MGGGGVGGWWGVTGEDEIKYKAVYTTDISRELVKRRGPHVAQREGIWSISMPFSVVIMLIPNTYAAHTAVKRRIGYLEMRVDGPISETRTGNRRESGPEIWTVVAQRGPRERDVNKRPESAQKADGSPKQNLSALITLRERPTRIEVALTNYIPPAHTHPTRKNTRAKTSPHRGASVPPSFPT